MGTINTRVAISEDLELVAPLFDAYRQFYGRSADLPLARAFLAQRLQNNESVILLATTDIPAAVGFCQLYPSFCSVEAQPIYVLYDLFVAPEARRYGVGRALLKAAEEVAARNGKVRLDLATAKTNKAAQAAYKSLGWTRDELFYTYNKRVPQ